MRGIYESFFGIPFSVIFGLVALAIIIIFIMSQTGSFDSFISYTSNFFAWFK